MEMKRILRIVLALFVALSLFLYLFPASPASADETPDHYVDAAGSNTSPYDTVAKAAHSIQDAVNAAASGDTVHVAAGTYNESITLKAGVNVMSDSGASATILNGGGSSRIFYAMNLYSAPPRLDGFTLTNGDPAIELSQCPITITNCVFRGNANSGEYGRGGAIKAYNCDYKVYNCTFAGNSAGDTGGAIYNSWGTPTITNCTFYGNSATNGGGAISNYNSDPYVTNCILWNDSPDEIYDIETSNPTVSYCVVQGGYSGTDIHTQDPCLVDPDGADDTIGTADDDFHLDPDPPTQINIESGNNAAVPSWLTTDFEGEPRIMIKMHLKAPAVVDRGADEYKPANDAPQLSTHGLSPSSGYTDTEFTYYVFYSDSNWDPPYSITVSIDGGTPHPMIYQYGNTYEGERYEYETSGLAPGSHTYQFAATDSVDAATGDTGMYSGPTVTNRVPNAPQAPKCEGQTNPTKVGDSTPEFSWTFSDDDAGNTQGAYQVLVTSGAGGTGDTMWDSGKVTSSDSEVSYAGDALAPSQTYYWKVKTWDNYDAEGAYCAEQQYTMEQAPNAPASPLCEGLTNPTGVPPAPEFSWTFSDPDAGDTQGAYQILVASVSEGAADMWDSGKVTGSDSTVSYAGDALAPSQTCYWKVKTWDNYDAEGAYSAEQQFTTQQAPNAPVSLLCEGLTNPTGVPPAPEFSWTFSDPDAGDTQGAYQILVTSGPGGTGDTMWDSGKVSSSDNLSTYAGTALAPSQTCYWKVKTWDNYDADGDYCAEQHFTTQQAPNAPASPLCEGVTNPTGVTDPTPEFSWTFSDNDTLDTQYAYQILVASTSGGAADMWDSGKVTSSANLSSYAGTALSDNQTCYWKVKTWDNYDTEGTYCAEQQFTTGAPQSEVWVDASWAGSSHGDAVGSHTFGTNAFAAIKDGIDGVSSNSTVPGTVNVAPGTYYEQLFINKAYLTVQSTAGAATTIIDGTGVTNSSPESAALVWLQKDYITFSGFTLHNYPAAWGSGAVIWVQGYDGRALVEGISHCQVSGNKIDGSPSSIPGILVSGEAVSANVTQNEIVNSGRDGILFTAPPGGGFDIASITNNTVTDAADSGICLRPDSPTNFIDFFTSVISGNEISGGQHGISIQLVSHLPTDLRIEDNTITGVVTGDGEGIEIFNSSYVHVLGNTLQGNQTGIRIEECLPGALIDTCSARNNNIIGNTSYGIEAVDCTDNFTATNNWWGDASGPYHATTNSGGAGDNVTDFVNYSSWLGAAVTDCKSQDTSSGNVTVDATGETDTQVLKTGTGNPTINIVQLTGNPGGDAPGGFTATGKYIDVYIDTATNVDEIEIRSYYTTSDISGLNESTLKLSWWNGTAWVECSDSGATYPAGGPTYKGYVWAKIRSDTIPTLAQLTGSPFTSMARPSASQASGGYGITKYYLSMDMLGTTQRVIRNSAGRVLEPAAMTSADGVLSITILQSTMAKDKNGTGLTALDVSVNENPPLPPEDHNIIGLIYDFQPAGATFDPPITLSFTFDPTDIPESIAEEGLVIAYYDKEAGKWVECECTFDPKANCITACISHFTSFALLGQKAPETSAAFSLSNLSIQPTGVEPAEAVTVTVSVANTGAVEGTCGLVLKVDGVQEASEDITVAAGASQSVSFTISREAPGNHTVNVSGLEGSFTVVAPTAPPPAPLPPQPSEPTQQASPAPPAPLPAPASPSPAPETNWVVLGIIIAAVVVVVVVVIFVARRRAA